MEIKKPYTVGKLPAGEWEKTVARLLTTLTTEFKDPKDWSYLPSVMLLVGAGLMHKGGVCKEDRDRMVDKYLQSVQEHEKAAQN